MPSERRTPSTLFRAAGRFVSESPLLRHPLRLVKWYDIDAPDNRDEEWIDYLYRWFGKALMRYFRAEVRGLQRIPPGPGLYVGNHNASTLAPEALIFGTAVYQRYGVQELPIALGHEIAIRFPFFHQFAIPMGIVRASHENARKVFEQGGKVLVFPGGDIEANRPFWKRDRIVFGGRRGYIRLALSAGVPIIPVVAAGAHDTFIILHDGRPIARALFLDRLFRLDVWPITLSIPWGLTIGPPFLYVPFPARVLMEILPPIRFSRTGPEAARDERYVAACADKVETVMQATLEHLERERRTGK